MSQLGPHNFRRIGLNRMVVAAVVDPEEDLAAQGAEALMRAAAAGFHADIREAFAFGVLDGRRWDEYIATFDLQVSDLPRVLVLYSCGGLIVVIQMHFRTSFILTEC
mgnify:CR=1 FL=1